MAPDLCEVEIREIAPLAAREAALLDHHSILNVLNILHGELTLLGLGLEDDPEALRESLPLCREFIGSLYDTERTLSVAARADDYADRILAEIGGMTGRQPDQPLDADLARSLSNIQGVLAIWRVRSRELLARARHPTRWESMRIEALQKNFRTVFGAMEANSRGRFRIVYSFARQGPCDYYLDLRFESEAVETIRMPPVLVDVLRDLIANARKYTEPGGRIIASLHEGPADLRLAVQDTGRGIAENELREVVEFGRRGSNAADVRTMGGGFGLTKAFLVTRQFGGRFWIASRLGSGTRVRLELPKPVDGNGWEANGDPVAGRERGAD